MSCKKKMDFPKNDFVRPDKKHECTYEAWRDNKTVTCPHHLKEAKPRDSNVPCASILDMVGNTPLVHLKNISADYKLKCKLYGKCEYMNAGGSVKDRIGLRMVEEAERDGYLKPGHYVIEPTSGNTGIGLALACAVKGYKCIIVMPEKMSKEKNDVLKALGATIVRTRTSAAFDDVDSHIMEAQRIKERLNEETPGCAHILDQYTNPYNPIAHYDYTGQEILDQLNNKVHMVISAAGTGGTVCGLARKIKERCPDCILVGVDPIGSILAEPAELNKDLGEGFYEVEGTGYDFLPTVLDRKRVDSWFKSVDKESFAMSRQLIAREGMMVGGSAGSALYCAIKAIEKYDMKEGHNVVCILPDSVRNYMTKYLSDEWMITRGFLDVEKKKDDPSWFHDTVSSLPKNAFPDCFVTENTTCAQAVEHMKTNRTDCLLIVKDSEVKAVTKKSLMAKLVRGDVSGSDLALKACIDRIYPMHLESQLREVQCCLEAEGYAVILKKKHASSQIFKKDDVSGVLPAESLLDYITTANGKKSNGKMEH